MKTKSMDGKKLTLVWILFYFNNACSWVTADACNFFLCLLILFIGNNWIC